MRELILLVGLALGAVLAWGIAWGGNGPEAVEEGAVDAERAELIALTCTACHGTEGRVVTEIPPLAGRPEAVLQAQLIAFKRDEMPQATVMPRLAKGFTEEELRVVARYFASLDADE